MKNKWSTFSKHYKETKKSSFIVFFISVSLVILCIVRQLILGNYRNISLSVFPLLLLFLPIFIQYKFKIVLSNILEIFIYIFIFSAGILGEIYHFYINVPLWDLFLHIFSGFLCAGIGLSFIDLLNDNQKQSHLFPIMLALFSFCFSMTTSVFWEFGEYAIDKIFLTDAQKDVYINEFSSIKLDESKNSQPVKIKNIYKTILYNENNQELTTIYGGYLDIGLKDTMKDLFANFFGAIIYSISGYFYAKNRNKKNLASKFIFVKG